MYNDCIWTLYRHNTHGKIIVVNLVQHCQYCASSGSLKIVFGSLRGRRESEETRMQVRLTLDLCHSDSLSLSFLLSTPRSWLIGSLVPPSSISRPLIGWALQPTWSHGVFTWLGGQWNVFMHVFACGSWTNPNTTSYICLLLSPIPPPLSPNRLCQLANMLHALNSSFLNRPGSLNPATQTS